MEYENVAKGAGGDPYKDVDEFAIWIQNGIERGWVTEPFCYTHDGDPYMTDEEEKEWEEGGDPCSFVIKIVQS